MAGTLKSIKFGWVNTANVTKTRSNIYACLYAALTSPSLSAAE
jgi:hypothetical protein